MNPDRAAELAGKLNPRTCHLERGCGGIPEYTEADIAAAIGMLKLERDRLWVRIIYAGHEHYRTALERELLMMVVNLATQPGCKRWHIETPGTLLACIRMAVEETARTTICRSCNGQKQIILRTGEMAGKPIICSDCKGSGYGRMSDYLRVKRIGMDKPRWRIWKTRYELILDQCRLIDGRAKSALAHRLG